MTELHPTLTEIAPGVATAIYRRYRGYVEKEDVLQECYLWATSRNASLVEQLNEENALRRMANERRIAWQMKRHAERYARKYALNAMFLIDDTKDADATNNHAKDSAPRTPALHRSQNFLLHQQQPW